MPIVVIGRRVRLLSRSSQDRIAGVGTMVAEVLGAIKVVQAFTQERREAARFGDAVEATFAAAKRRILARAVMTAIIITLLFGAIVLDPVGRCDRRHRRADDRRHASPSSSCTPRSPRARSAR